MSGPSERPDGHGGPPDEHRPSSHPTRPPSNESQTTASRSTKPPETKVSPPLGPHSVPKRALDRDAAALTEVDVRTGFLLLHVDGHQSLTAIAELASLPFEEVRRAFAFLAAEGLVELVAPGRDPRTVSPPEPERA